MNHDFHEFHDRRIVRALLVGLGLVLLLLGRTEFGDDVRNRINLFRVVALQLGLEEIGIDRNRQNVPVENETQRFDRLIIERIAHRKLNRPIILDADRDHTVAARRIRIDALDDLFRHIRHPRIPDERPEAVRDDFQQFTAFEEPVILDDLHHRLAAALVLLGNLVELLLEAGTLGGIVVFQKIN